MCFGEILVPAFEVECLRIIRNCHRFHILTDKRHGRTIQETASLNGAFEVYVVAAGLCRW